MAAPKTGPTAPKELTAERHQRIVRALASGCYLETAAAAAGISNDTLGRWLKRGEAGEEPFAAFAQDVMVAAAEWEVGAMARIATAATEQWQADAWRLERRFPHKYGRRVPKDDDSQDAKAKGAVRELVESLKQERETERKKARRGARKANDKAT